MAKGYWLVIYNSIKNHEKFAAYAKLSAPAMISMGGCILARGLPTQVYENGVMQRTVIVEFESVAAAIAAHNSPAYREAARVLDDAAEREIRIVEGI